MKSVLVTGAGGFIGTPLADVLEKNGFDVIKLDTSRGDIVDLDLIHEYKDKNIDHIFHLASKTFVPDSWEHPMDFYKTSVIGTGNILELCRDKKASITYVSAYVYGVPEKLPISENDKILSNNPYAHSKYLAEELCRFYSEFYDIHVTIARPFNIYGKNQKEMFLIPYIIKQVLNEKTIRVKDLNPKRDYIYLDDLVSGLIKTLDANKKFSIFNFGSGEGKSVKEIIEIVQEVAGTHKPVISEEQERKNEVMNVIADITKAKKDLNWKPVFSFKDGISDILNHLNQNLSEEKC